MRHVLVLGGGSFVGGALVRDALGRGWTVTCLTRGRLPLPDGVRTLVADRLDPSAMAAVLAGRDFELVADTWDRAPSAVVTSARVLAGSACRYGYISTRSVYSSWPDGADESADVVPADPDAGRTGYGADKRGGELAAVRELGPDRVSCFRAGGILGPGENYGRLPWWLGRLARGGPTLAPGPAELALQYVDVRDLARFVWDALSAGVSGPIDTVSPSGHTTMGEFLGLGRELTGSHADLVWVDPDWLVSHGVIPWRELPVWAPRGHPFGGLHTSDTSRAVAAGLRCRPVRDTIADTLASIRRRETPAEPIAPGLGLDPAKEARLLAEWSARYPASSRP